MSTNYGKMSTAILKKKLTTAGTTPEEKKAIKAVIAKREGQIPEDKLKETKIKFTTRSGLNVEGLICSVLVGKKDGKTYYGVKKDEKLYYKQKDSTTVVK